MKKLIISLFVALGFALSALPAAANEGYPWDKFPEEKMTDMAALQNGARIFVNYCLNCQSAQYMRYNRLHDIGLNDDEIRKNLLFAGSIGRTDLPGGDHATMERSLASKVLPLRDEVVVLPGHGPQTTIGRERATNPYLQGLPAVPPARGL